MTTLVLFARPLCSAADCKHKCDPFTFPFLRSCGKLSALLTKSLGTLTAEQNQEACTENNANQSGK